MDPVSAQLLRQTLKPVGTPAGDDDVPSGLAEPLGGESNRNRGSLLRLR